MDITLALVLIVVGLLAFVAGWQKWTKKKDAAKAVGVIILLVGLAFQFGWIASPLAVTPSGVQPTPTLAPAPAATQVAGTVQGDLELYPKVNGTSSWTKVLYLNQKWFLTTIPYASDYAMMKDYIRYGYIYQDAAQTGVLQNTSWGTDGKVSWAGFAGQIGQKYKLCSVYDSSPALEEAEYKVFDLTITGYNADLRKWDTEVTPTLAVYVLGKTKQVNDSDLAATGFRDYRASAVSTSKTIYIRPDTIGGALKNVVMYIESSSTNITGITSVVIKAPGENAMTFDSFSSTNDLPSGDPIRQSAPAQTHSTWYNYVVNPNNPVSSIHKSDASNDAKGMIAITVNYDHPASSDGYIFFLRFIDNAPGGTYIGTGLHNDFSVTSFKLNLTSASSGENGWE